MMKNLTKRMLTFWLYTNKKQHNHWKRTWTENKSFLADFSLKTINRKKCTLSCWNMQQSFQTICNFKYTLLKVLQTRKPLQTGSIPKAKGTYIAYPYISPNHHDRRQCTFFKPFFNAKFWLFCRRLTHFFAYYFRVQIMRWRNKNWQRWGMGT